MESEIESRQERVNTISHVLGVKVLSSEFLSAYVVVPDLVANDGSEGQK